MGKSAQFPLHVWLPDAMEGPTPVSALIHAATMVAAGVYMLSRVFFLVHASPVAQEWIAIVGTITTVMAALMALQQNDIKRILAYSTLSQIGYMVTAIGMASEQAAMFHLFTHAFFKALLFLGSGAVIYGTHHEQDIWKMGGLKNRLPTTFLTFLVGTLALTGCPGLAGFFSKDLILSTAREHHPLIFTLLLTTAFLTAFYMFRLMAVVFGGRTRSAHARDGHQPPPVMTIPLMILAVPSVIAGYRWFAGRFVDLPAAEHLDLVLALLSFAVFAAGALSAWTLYAGKDSDPISIPLFANKFYIDEIYAFVIAWTQDFLAWAIAMFDRFVLDGAIVRGVFSGGVWVTGFMLRFLQFGNLQAYAFLFGIGAVSLIYFILSGKL